MIAVTQISYLGPGARTAPCHRCGRRLRDPVSVSLGIGPKCRTIAPPPKEASIMSIAVKLTPVVTDELTSAIEMLKEQTGKSAEEIVRDALRSTNDDPAPAPIEQPVYMGWQAAPKTTPLQSLVDACDHYRQTRRRDALVILAAPTVAAAIAEEAWVRERHLEIRGQAGVSAGMFYVGVA